MSKIRTCRFDYVRDNFRQNEVVSYTFYVNNHLDLPNNLEDRFRELLANDNVRSKSRTKNRTAGTLQVVTVDVPIHTQIVLYYVRRNAVRERNPILYERLRNFVTDEDMVGIVLAASVVSQINTLMDEEHLQFAQQFLQYMERHAVNGG